MIATLVALALIFPVQSGPGPLSTNSDTTPSVWQIDPGHSEVSFRIRHFMSRVRGTFNQWSGTITGDSAWAGASVDITIETASIDTRHEARDQDLRSPNFFDAAAHPAITFKSSTVQVTGNDLLITGHRRFNHTRGYPPGDS